MSDDDIDWVLIQKVERDICLLYHQLAEYACVMGDLYWGSVYDLPYWEFVGVGDLGELGYSDFIRDGCLIMIPAMAWQKIDGAGGFVTDKIALCRAAVEAIDPTEEQTKRLVETVRLALDEAQRDQSEPQECYELSRWVYRHYVRAYFERMAEM
jgi:hypothetical protein